MLVLWRNVNNPRITPKERGLLKGAVRRVFSRSELRKKVLDASVASHATMTFRPKVKCWCKCAGCGKLEAKSYMVVDHIDPLIPVNQSMLEMSWDEVIDRTWCVEANLQVLCPDCHDTKTAAERVQRKRNKNGK